MNKKVYVVSDTTIETGKKIIDYLISLGGKNPKKIIATTNSKLIINIGGDTLPKPSPQFIQNYIEEWNKGNKIEFVNVEYEELIAHDRQGNKLVELSLKVDKSNCITITKIKDSWNREEVMNLVENAYDSGRYAIINNDIDQTFDKWIEQNL
jgi:hypothetical protein